MGGGGVGEDDNGICSLAPPHVLNRLPAAWRRRAHLHCGVGWTSEQSPTELIADHLLFKTYACALGVLIYPLLYCVDPLIDALPVRVIVCDEKAKTLQCHGCKRRRAKQFEVGALEMMKTMI